MPSAQADLEEYADRIALDSEIQARKWLNGAWNLIFSLAEMPSRYSISDESPILNSEIRDVSHFSHRIVFRIIEEDQVVEVLRLWHMARRPISFEDV